MKTLLAIVILLLSVTASAQTAKVIALSPKDAAKAKELQVAVDKALAAQKAFRADVAHRYLAVDERPDGQTSGCSLGERGGWSYFKWGGCGEFEYSEDYLFIVPKPEPPYASSSGSGGTIIRYPVACGGAIAW